MPEGDTIYRSARAMSKVLQGKIVTGFESEFARLSLVDDNTPLVGRTIERIESRGKWLLVFFSGDLILVTHMLMSGSWHLYRIAERWQRPRSAMRMVIHTEAWDAVGFNIPVAEFHTERTLMQHKSITGLGPDILSLSFEPVDGMNSLKDFRSANPQVEVGDALLNQRVMAGLGNVYKSEVCFAAKVHPFRAMRTITDEEVESLTSTAQRYMNQNIRDGVDGGIVTYTGLRRTTRSSYHGARLWVYRRRGEECRRCGTPIEMKKQGVGARSTFWCPRCQT
jgi:endonuclease-8